MSTVSTQKTYPATWKTYQDAWANVSDAERQRLLEESVADDCTFTSPVGQGKGRGQLTAHIEQFQQQFPGATFKTHTLLDQHAQALAEWIMYDKTGAEYLPGKSYARFHPDGRLVHLAGFWKA